MFNSNYDLGQIVITILIMVVGYFIRREISNLNSRLDRHDSMILGLVGNVQRIIGIVEVSRKVGVGWFNESINNKEGV